MNRYSTTVSESARQAIAHDDPTLKDSVVADPVFANCRTVETACVASEMLEGPECGFVSSFRSHSPR